MRHRVAGRKLGRTSSHRLALMRNLSTSLFDKERIRTTLMKAKELRPFAERLVTLAKRETLHARRQVLRHIHDGAVVAKLFDALSARYAQRPGGYTRIIKLGPRRGDNAEMAIIELVGREDETAAETAVPEKGKRSKRKRKPKRAAESTEASEKKKAAKKKPAKKKTTKKTASSGAKEKTTKKSKSAKKAKSSGKSSGGRAKKG